ncbi:MAG: carboxypeptidase-like regulatory domain-containing protein, partial [Muribaculaceae bacterium]|nr:carboxypeptidase-like regulatory domain-containing protein [Muribaculaceae bacterium]
MASPKKYILSVFTICLLSLNMSAKDVTGIIFGKVLSSDGEPIDYANVYLKGTTFSGTTNNKGFYHINAPEGDYTIVFSLVG